MKSKDYFTQLLENSAGHVVKQHAGEGDEPPAPPVKLTPWVVYEALQELEPNINRGQTLKEGRRLIEQGYTLAEIVACAQSLLDDDWRRSKGIPLNASAVAKNIRAHIESNKGGKWTPL